MLEASCLAPYLFHVKQRISFIDPFQVTISGIRRQWPDRRSSPATCTSSPLTFFHNLPCSLSRAVSTHAASTFRILCSDSDSVAVPLLLPRQGPSPPIATVFVPRAARCNRDSLLFGNLLSADDFCQWVASFRRYWRACGSHTYYYPSIGCQQSTIVPVSWRSP